MLSSQVSFTLKQQQALESLLSEQIIHPSSWDYLPAQSEPIRRNSQHKPKKNIRINQPNKKSIFTIDRTIPNKSISENKQISLIYKQQKNLCSNIFIDRSKLELGPKRKVVNRIYFNHKQFINAKDKFQTICADKSVNGQSLLRNQNKNIFRLSFSQYCSKKKEEPNKCLFSLNNRILNY